MFIGANTTTFVFDRPQQLFLVSLNQLFLGISIRDNQEWSKHYVDFLGYKTIL
jgi:hypothetical protein